MKSDNFYDNSNCIIKKDCPFYRKDNYNAGEILFYQDHCLRAGEGCGLKRNHDVSERIRNKLERNLNDKYPQDQD